MAQAVSDSDDSDPTFQPFSLPSRKLKAGSSSQGQLQQSRGRQDITDHSLHSKNLNSTSRQQQSQKKSDLSQSSSSTQQLPTPFRSPHPLSTSNPVFKDRNIQQPTLSTQPSSEAIAAATADTLAKYPETYITRPNRYFGPSSTWRSWTDQERTVALSLERERGQDLSIHLYNAYALRRQAELATAANGGRGAHSGSRTRSRSRSQTSRRGDSAKGKGKTKAKDKGKGKGKARADIPSSPQSITADIPTDEEDQNQDQTSPLTFNPPRLWTAWPLPPNEVPREQLIPTAILGGADRDPDTIRSRYHDARPSAELEECLIAIMSRIARERWDAREWAAASDEDDDAEDGRARKRVKRKKEGSSMGTKGGSMKGDVRMLDDTDADEDDDDDDGDGDETADQDTTDNDPNSTTEHESSSQSSSQSPSTTSPSPSPSPITIDPEIPLFSSQAFTLLPPHPRPNPLSTQPPHHPPAPPIMKPTFSTSDSHLRTLLLPSTRHILSQLDALLRGLHRMHAHARKRKTAVHGIRGREEILGVAGIYFDGRVVERARGRCDALFDGNENENGNGGRGGGGGGEGEGEED